ncbi:MAG: extracellular solute-binding protein, partial [Lapillicoccus sp.]
MRRTALTALATLPVVVLVLAGCGSSTDSGSTASRSSSSGSTTASGVTGTVSVFAAASLKTSFTAIGKAFEAAYPGAKVTFNFGPSSGLATSITQGNPADVFASASPTNMDSVVKASAASDPTTFARNVMQIAVPPTNPAGIT